MAKLVAIDVAILPPPDVAARVVALSAGLPAADDGLRLDAERLPHITLTQQFVREDELSGAFDRVAEVLKEQQPFRVLVTGSGHSGHTLWLEVERSDALNGLHEQVMEALRGLERADGGPAAFFEGEGRLRDVLWVEGYRLKSSFGAFTPHITLGPGDEPPDIEPFTFEATTVAACQLGRFCSCRRALRVWTLT